MPRAVGQLFIAAQTDGWAEALASPPVRQFALAAEASWASMPALLADSESPGMALRALVSDAQRAALEFPAYATAGLMTSLAERGLSRLFVARIQTEGKGIHQLSGKDAATSWMRKRRTPESLTAGFLDEAVRSLTLHLILRDAPQLVGGPLGGAAAVHDLAWALADVAVKAAQPGHDLLMVTDQGDSWGEAVSVAWTGAREFATLHPDPSRPSDNKGGS